MPILEVKNARLYYSTSRGLLRALDDVSLVLGKGEALAIVGESGSGKSTLAKLLVRVWERNVALVDGEVYIDGREVLHLDEEVFRREIRWRRISMVPQGSMNALNPVIRIGDQMIEPLLLQGVSREEALRLAMDALESVNMPRDIVNRYPHQLSGGMRQRVIIAMAIMAKPSVVILDEPTSALDVITQANIMNLLKRLRREFELSYIFITHDLALASEIADTVAIMYAGKIAEMGPSEEIYGGPTHPYAQGLLSSIPTLRGNREPTYIPGEVPSLVNPPSGCRFHPRCPFYKSRDDLKGLCDREEPPMIRVGDRHVSACWLYRGYS